MVAIAVSRHNEPYLSLHLYEMVRPTRETLPLQKIFCLTFTIICYGKETYRMRTQL